MRAKVPGYGAAIETSIETGRALILTFTVETLKYSVAPALCEEGGGEWKKKGGRQRRKWACRFPTTHAHRIHACIKSVSAI